VPRANARAIAVLPFANQSSDPSLDYLADGFAESIINSQQDEIAEIERELAP